MTTRRRVTAVTGTRAEFGLLRPVLEAIDERPDLDLDVVAAGAHLLPPEHTIDEVRSRFEVAATVPMQEPGATGRGADARALGRGVSGFAEVLAAQAPDVVLVLGDRIEAFAAAASAAVGGVRVAHLHGGDRAEGIADEALRHAITKLAHLHLPATAASAERIVAMGEDPARVHVVGSPAIDDLASLPPLTDDEWDALGRPEIVVLFHPIGRADAVERADAERLIAACAAAGRTLVLHPNHDAGRDGIIAAITASGVRSVPHLPRPRFIGLLRRARVIVGNSSAGLIEAAALPVPAVDVGRRQAGRERAANVVACPGTDPPALRAAIARALAPPAAGPAVHPYGDGRAGGRTAEILATFDADKHPLAKRNTF